MATIPISFTHKAGDPGSEVLVDVTSVVLEDPTSTYGVKRNDTDATVVASGTALVKQDTGVYQYTFTAPADGLDYTYFIKYVYLGVTTQTEYTISGVSESPDYSQLQNMRQEFRDMTGMSTSDDITDSNIDVRLNDAYTTVLPDDIDHDSLETDFTQAISVDDDGVYSLAVGILEVQERATINNDDITQYFNKDDFFSDYPDEESYVTEPTLVIGTSSADSVKNSAFDYKIADWVYTKASAETLLSGDTVPQSKYGAWLLTIDADGDITISEASNNSTGYDTPGRAVNGITASSTSTDAAMGFVTAINTSGTFIPGTTDLDASGVTSTFTDGDPGLRSATDAFLIDGRKLYVRPKSDDKGLFRARLMVKRPTELSADTSSVFDEKWGTAIATAAAAAYMSVRGDIDKAVELTGDASIPGTYEFLKTRITRDGLIQDSNKPFMRRW